MEKEKLINYAYFSVCIVVILGLVVGLKTLNPLILCGCFIIYLTVACPLKIQKEKIKEAKNPFNKKRVYEALSFCYTQWHGDKSDFIDRYGEEMYNHFTSKGYLSETSKQDDYEWRLTKLGLRAKVHCCS